VTLSACGGGDDDANKSDNTPLPNSGEPIPGEDGYFHEIHGKVRFFDLQEATVSAYSLANVKIAEGLIDENGEVNLRLENQTNQVLKLKVTGGFYTEPATQNTINLNTESLNTFYTFSSSSENPDFFISLATHLQAALIENGKTKTYSKALIENYLGYAFLTVKEFSSLSDTITYIDFSDEAKASAFQTAFSQLVYDLLVKNSFTKEQQVANHLSTIRFLELMYLDLVFDAELDGEQASGSVIFANSNVNSISYRTELGLALLKFIQGDENNSSLSASDAFDYAESLSAHSPINTPLFGNNPPHLISDLTPTISNESPSSDEPIVGIKTFTFDVLDIAGITQVGFIFGTDAIEFALDVNNPSFEVDTTQYSDGIYPVILNARNLGNQIAELSFNVIVTNNGTVISNLNPKQNQLIRGTYLFSADAVDPIGINEQYFYINSVQLSNLTATASGFQKSINTAIYSDGLTTFKVEVTNTIPEIVEKSSTFTIDNTKPTVDLSIDEGDFIEGENFLINPNISDVNGIASANLFFDSVFIDDELDLSSYQFDTTNYEEGEYTL